MKPSTSALLLLLLPLLPLASSATTLSFYGEASCPECQDFVSGVLDATLSAEGVLDAVDFQFVPWGNAYFNTTQCGGADGYSKDDMFCWVKQCNVAAPAPECFNASQSPVLCQHGPGECQQDALEGCAFAVADSVKDAWSFLRCFEGTHRSDLGSAEECAQGAGIDYGSIQTCTKGPQAEKIDVANAMATVKLGSAKLGTPWVLVDGTLVGGGPPYTNLLDVVCESLRKAGGDVPKGCH